MANEHFGVIGASSAVDRRGEGSKVEVKRSAKHKEWRRAEWR